MSLVEIVEHRRGTGWVVDRVVELDEKHHPAAVIIDGASPAASLIPELGDRGVTVTVMQARDQAAASGFFYDTVEQSRLRHPGSQELEIAIRGAAQRNLSDSWAWSRKNSNVDISPLIVVTDALWGLATTDGDSVYETRGALVLGR